MPAFPDTASTELAPDWVCELLSPSTRRLDLTEKRDLYGVHGVGHLWLADPEAQTLEVFASRRGTWALAGVWSGGAPVRAEPFEAVEFPLSALWPD